MKSHAPLNGSQLRTYHRIFQHPISHNLAWSEVYGMFRQLGDVKVEANGNTKVTRNGQFMVLPPHQTKDVAEAQEVMAIRHFLEKTEAYAAGPDELGAHWLVVIDHHEARLFRSEMHGSVPEQILPHEPDHFFRHAHNSRDFTRGEEKPDPNSYFEPLARALLTAKQILVFGTGTGMSSEMDQFVGWLKDHHPDLSKRVIGSVVVDENHLTVGQLLAKAREFYSNALPSPV
ncbi:MAG: hypothetical protein WCA95_07965 [Opitutaceae bacterium]